MRNLLIPLLLVLAAPLAAEEPAERPGYTALTDEGSFRVTLRPEGDVIPIGRFHRWSLRVEDAAGAPVGGAQIRIGGGMEAHGHGLPTSPRAVPTKSSGEYVIEGLKLTMAGEWTLLIAVQHGAAQDVARFKLQVDY